MDVKEHFLALILYESLEDENMKACKDLLIVYKANPNVILLERGIAPIHYACGMENEKFSEEIVKIMLDLQGNPNVRSEENLTPLHVAAVWGRPKIVKMLLKHGGDVTLLDNDYKTPILYALYEGHHDVISVFQEHVFEQKLEKAKQRAMNNLNGSSRLAVLKNLDDQKFTPNRINYNFDATSPYYINITHRRKHDTVMNEGIGESTKSSDVDTYKSFHEHIPENLFKLTEDNLIEYSKQMSGDHSKFSFIKTWREKVQKSKTRKSIINQFNNIDSLLSGIMNNNSIDFTNTSLYVEGQDLEELEENGRKSFSLTQFGKLLEQLKAATLQQQDEKTDESFVTAEADRSSFEMKQQTLNQSDFIRSPKPNEYAYICAEEYVHTDEENGLVFYEKRLITEKATNKLERNDELNQSHATTSTKFTVPTNYDTDELRKELTMFGDPPKGPITESTKKLYTKRLIKYKRNPKKMIAIRQAVEEIKLQSRPNFSVELEKTVRQKEWFNRIMENLELESQICEYFQNSEKMKFETRGHTKTNFIYFLIDPRISDNLPAQSIYTEEHEIWKKFLNSIFYVGKGKSSRPYQHLYDAMKIFSRYYEQETNEILEKVQIYGKQKIPKIIPKTHLVDASIKDVTDNHKIERILDIWKSEKGVICLNVFHNILSAEAFTREAAIIDAFGLEHLANKKRGEYYGLAKSWPMRQRKNFGIVLLYKALKIYLLEGEAQLLPSDLI